MARFVFEFEAVLKQRLAEEREKQLVMASIERERLAIEGEIRALQASIEDEKAGLRSVLEGGGVDLAAVRQQASAALGRVRQAQHQAIKLAGVHKRLESARMELLLATTRRKAMETLRERRLEAWKADQSRRENAALDEINIMRAGRDVDALVGRRMGEEAA